MILTCSVFIFSMVVKRGSDSLVDGLKRPGLSGDEIQELIATPVTVVVREAIPEMSGSVKTILVEMFDEHYVANTEDATAVATSSISVVRLQSGGSRT